MTKSFKDKIKRIFDSVCDNLDDEKIVVNNQKVSVPSSIVALSRAIDRFKSTRKFFHWNWNNCKPHIIFLLDPLSPVMICGKCFCLVDAFEHQMSIESTKLSRKKYKRRWERGR